jgi:alginate O-acetyltransferase complex protein AlgI
MNFCTLEFLLFFVVMFGVYWGMPSRRVRLGLMAVTGPYFLYTTWLCLASVHWPAVSWLSLAYRPGADGTLVQEGTTWLLNTFCDPGSTLASGIRIYWMAGIIFVVTSLAGRVGHHQGRVWLLTAGSFFFYACFNQWLALVICVSTAMDYAIARGLDALTSQRLRRCLLVLSLVANLGLLVYFKYANFFLDSLAKALHALGSSASLPWLSVILPIGISFYTFEAINYTIDVYRRKVPAEKNLGNFMLFITFFPHLVAGPIVRARDFLPQIHRRKRWDWPRMQLGVQFFLMGLFKKLAIADRMSYFVKPVFESPDAYGSGPVWLATIAYALQIYCDFSGYTDMALGCAHMLGYKLAQNFNMPYIAGNISEFWRRWHISLSSWLRDYLFIPLGGSRGTKWHTYRNLMITMTLGGLWHGASWTYVIWGVLHGLFLIIHRSFRDFCERRPRVDRLVHSLPGKSLCWGLTLFAVCVGWVFFCAAGVQSGLELKASEEALKTGAAAQPVQYSALKASGTMIKKLVIPHRGAPSPLPNQSLWYTVGLVVLCHALAQRGRWKRLAARLPAPVMGLGYATVLTLALLLAPALSQVFIYFQF